jgi:PAS domain S-box-containing protein
MHLIAKQDLTAVTKPFLHPFINDNQYHSLEDLINNISRYYETVIAHMPGNVYWLDSKCRGVGCNNNVLAMFGLSSIDEFYGMDFDKMQTVSQWATEATAKFKRDTLYVMHTGIPILNTEEPPIPHANGNLVYFLTSRVPVFNQRNEVIAVVGISIDITDRKRLEAARVEEELAKKHAAIFKQAAGSIAHDLRTPLASIRFAINGIEQMYNKILQGYELAVANNLIETDPADKLTLFQRTIESAKRELTFANNYIDMTLNNIRHDEQLDTSHYTLHAIAPIIEHSLRAYPFQTEEATLVTWQHTLDFMFWGDDAYVKNILNNLLKNALFHIHKAQKGQIRIWLEQGALENRLYFEDTAEGAPAEVIACIFDNFYSTRKEGSGLGLTFCKMAMLSFGGNIHAESEYREYMRFILTFPKQKQ